MTTRKERLKLILKKLNITAAELSRKTRIDKGSISSYLNPENKKQPGGKFALALQKTFNVNPDWLLTGEGEMFIEESQKELGEYSKEEIKALYEFRDQMAKDFSMTSEEVNKMAILIQSKATIEILDILSKAFDGDKEAIAELKGMIKILEKQAEKEKNER